MKNTITTETIANALNNWHDANFQEAFETNVDAYDIVETFHMDNLSLDNPHYVLADSNFGGYEIWIDSFQENVVVRYHGKQWAFGAIQNDKDCNMGFTCDGEFIDLSDAIRVN